LSLGSSRTTFYSALIRQLAQTLTETVSFSPAYLCFLTFPLSPTSSLVLAQESGQAITRFLPKTSKELKVNAPPPILYKKQSKGRITDFDPQEIARQLTLIESKIYNSIRPVECLANAWSDKANPMRAPHIKSAIQNTNLVSFSSRSGSLAEGIRVV
jgi:hypothetical protein